MISERFINEYKTDIENTVFAELKRAINSNKDIETELELIEENLGNYITKELAPKFYNDAKNAVKEDILNRVTGFTYNMDDTFRYPVRKAIHNTINDVFNGKDVSESLGTNLEYTKNAVTDNLIRKVDYKINDEINNLSYEAMKAVREHIYKYDDPTGLTPIAGNFINNNIRDVTDTLKTGVRELLTNGTINTDLSKKLETSLINNIESAKSSIMSNVHNKAVNGINGILNKVNLNISDILHNTYGTDLSGAYSPNRNVNGTYTTPGFSGAYTGNKVDNSSTAASVTNSAKTNTYRTDEITSSSTSTDRSTTVFKKSSTNVSNDDSVSNIKQDINKTAENKRNQEINTNQKAVPNSNVKDATTPSNNDDKPSHESGDGPSEENNGKELDNSTPPEAKTKDDPRRDKCQELVLWEASDRQYVLLRDGTGQHIVLDETGQFIRIQHPIGSFIEFDKSGNIWIQSKSKVYINCTSAVNVNRK